MQHRYYHRFMEGRLQVAARGRTTPKVQLILGARQTGKSTLLRHHLKGDRRPLVINLQDRRLRRDYEADPGRLLRELEAEPGSRTVVIDEIQKVPGLLEDVQLLYDRDPRRFRFFLTGSSARRLRRGAANLLPGRLQIIELTPVLQAEQRKAEILPLRMPGGRRFPRRSLEDYLLYGNLPGLYHEARESWEQTLAAYVDLYIENEVRQEHLAADMGAFVRFLRLAALESGQTVNYSKLATAIGVAPNTLRNFYRILEDTRIGIRIDAFGRSRRRLLQAPRFLIFDLGVRHLLADLPLSDTLLKLDPGHIFEQFILLELYYRCSSRGKGYRLSTWRTAGGAEVDAVIETPEETIPVECKWTGNPRPGDAVHLENFIKQHPRLAHRGYLVCRCPRPQRLSEHVIALPWNEF